MGVWDPRGQLSALGLYRIEQEHFSYVIYIFACLCKHGANESAADYPDVHHTTFSFFLYYFQV